MPCIKNTSWLCKRCGAMTDVHTHIHAALCRLYLANPEMVNTTHRVFSRLGGLTKKIDGFSG